MALPSGVFPGIASQYQDWGVVFQAQPSTVRTQGMELQVSTSTSAASSNWASIILQAGQTLAHIRTKATTQKYFARSRMLSASTASSWSAISWARPQQLLPTATITPVIRNTAGDVQVPANVLISSAYTGKVGTGNTAGNLTKTLRFPADGFQPTIQSAKFARGIGTFIVGSSATSGNYNYQYPLPKGVTVTKYSYTGTKRGTTSNVSKVELYKISTAGAATLICTLTMTTGTATAVATINSSVLSVPINDAQYLIARAYLKTTTATNKPSLIQSELTYTMPSYDKAY